MNEMNGLSEMNELRNLKETNVMSFHNRAVYFYIFVNMHFMIDESSEFIQQPKSEKNERIGIYRSRYFVLYKTKLANQWRIEKHVTSEYEFSPLQRTSIEREFEIGCQLDHPNIVRYIDKRATERGIPYLIMEYIDGKNLREYMQSQDSIEPQEFNRILMSLVNVLLYLQEKQIYHLDIKPENIVITYKEHTPKLIDFGLSSCDTYSAVLGGSNKYNSLEHDNYEKVSSKTDMYSLAVTMLEFAQSKHIKIGNRTKRVLSTCASNNPQKRLDATSALRLLQKKTIFRWKYLIVLIVLPLLLLLYKNRHKQMKEVDKTTELHSADKVLSDVASTITKPATGSVVANVEILPFEKKQKASQKVLGKSTELDPIIKLATSINNTKYQVDSAKIKQKAKELRDTFQRILLSDNTITDLDILRHKILKEYDVFSDSILDSYMKANQFGMVDAIGEIKFSVYEQLDNQLRIIEP